MVCFGDRSPESSFSRRTNWPMLGGRDTRPRPASQRSSLARVGPRGTAPRRKSRSPFGLIASSCAMRRNEDRAVSRAITSRSRGTGSAGRLTRVGTDAGLRLGLGAPARLNRNLTYEDSPPPWVTAQTEHGRYTPLPPEARPPGRLISSDFSRGFASCRSILAQQVLDPARSEEHTSELQSQSNLVCRLLLEKKQHTLS